MLDWLKYSLTLALVVCTGVLSAQEDTTRSEPQEKPEAILRSMAPIIIYAPVPYADKWEQINAKEMLERGATNLMEVLGMNSATFIRSYGINGVSSINMRGGRSEHTKIFWNGMDLTYPSLGQTDAGLIPLFSASSVRVGYGNSSLDLGSGGIGGVISLHESYQHWLDSTHIYAGQQVTSLLNSESRIRILNRSGKWYWSVFSEAGIGENRFKFRNPARNDWGLDTIQESDYQNLSFGGSVYRALGKIDPRRHRLGLSGWVRDSYKQLPRTVTQTNYQGEEMRDRLMTGVLSYSYIGYRHGLSMTSGLMSTDNHYINPQSSIDQNNAVNSWQTAVNWRFDVRDNTYPERLVVNARYYRDWANSASLPGNTLQNRFTSFARLTGEVRNRVRYSGALRVESTAGMFSGLLPKLDLSWRPQKENNLFLVTSWSKNVRFPTLNERLWSPGGNPDLLPERSWMYELGWRGSIRSTKHHHRFDLEMTGYWSQIKDWINWLPAGNIWSPINHKKVESRGIEFSVFHQYKRPENLLPKRIEIETKIRGHINQTRNLASYTGDSAIIGNSVIYAPRLQLLGSLRIMKKGWFTMYQQPITGQYFISTDNLWYMPWYTVSNLLIGKEWTKKKHGFTVSFGVNNLANRAYQVVPNRAMPLRHYKINITYRLVK